MNRRGFLQWLLAAVPAAAGAIYVPRLMVPVAKIQHPGFSQVDPKEIIFDYGNGNMMKSFCYVPGDIKINSSCVMINGIWEEMELVSEENGRYTFGLPAHLMVGRT